MLSLINIAVSIYYFFENKEKKVQLKIKESTKRLIDQSETTDLTIFFESMGFYQDKPSPVWFGLEELQKIQQILQIVDLIFNKAHGC